MIDRMLYIIGKNKKTFLGEKVWLFNVFFKYIFLAFFP